jgi:17beta-estradiol 17-dehydrogenase / very-long-chain 3-oxoacyl-CoA reductase
MELVKKNTTQFFKEVFSNSRNPTQNVLALLGAAAVAHTVWGWTKSFVRNFILPGKDLAARYGKGSWAVITGGSDGIGKAFAEELAERGFNIVILARSRDKMEALQATLQNQFKVKVITIQADFARSNEPEFWKVIGDELEGLDISILVSNVGYSNKGKDFVELTDKEIFQNFNINCLSHVNITRLLLPKMLERPQRGAIITVGSLAAYGAFPYYSTYAPAKAFLWYFSECNRKSYEHKLDVMCLNPGVVMTGFIPQDKPLAYHHIQPTDCARGALRQLGRVGTTEGHWKHQLQKWTNQLLPEWVLMNIMRKAGPIRLKKAREFFEKKNAEGTQTTKTPN